MTRRRRPTALHSFTLIELLIVVAILCVLASLLMPQLKRALESSRRTVCANNLKQQHTLLAVYSEDNTGQMPYSPQGWYWGLISHNVESEGLTATPVEQRPLLVFFRDYLSMRVLDINVPPWTSGVGSYVAHYFSNPNPRSPLFCPSRDGWIKNSSNPAWGKTYASSYAYFYSGIGLFGPGNPCFDRYGVPRLDRMGGAAGPIALLSEVFAFSGADGGGNHRYAGAHVLSERGVVRWHDYVSNVTFQRDYGGYPIFPKGYYTVGLWTAGVTFPIMKPDGGSWENHEEVASRLGIYGYPVR